MKPPRLGLAVWVAWASLAQAAPTSAPTPDAAQPQAAVPQATHCSVLRPTPAAAAPSPASAPAAPSWREANRAVDQAGGWRAYAREAARQQERPPPGAAVRCAEVPK